MSLPEAQLFRMLVALFGRDRVVWSMSTRAVCGGSFPRVLSAGAVPGESLSWAERDKCLFTVVDGDDNPKMVIEFSPDFSKYIEVEQIERQKHLPPLLGACGIQYVTMSSSELGEILDPAGSLDFVAFLKDKFGVDDSCDEQEEDELY